MRYALLILLLLTAPLFAKGRPEPLLDAVRAGDLAAVQRILEAQPERVNSPARFQGGKTPLHVAADVSNAAMVTLLLQRGADVSAQDARGCTPLFYATLRHDDEVIVLLQARGATLSLNEVTHLPDDARLAGWLRQHREDVASPVVTEALVEAVRNRATSRISLLLEAGVPVDSTDRLGCTALTYASARSLAMVEMLLAQHADPNHGALQVAAARRQSAIVQRLLAAGAVVDQVDELHRSPLFYAAESGDKTVMSLLLDAGANPNQRDNVGNTPVTMACSDTRLPALRLLLHRGGNPDVPDNEGCTCLHRANVAAIAVVLLNAGANPNALDHHGRTPLDVALENARHDDGFAGQWLSLADAIRRHGGCTAAALR